MTGTRRAGRSRRNESASPARLFVAAGVMLVAVLAALRFIPGSPFTADAAAQWGEPEGATRQSGSASPQPSRASRSTPAPTPSLPPLAVHPAEVRIDAVGWWSWALLDTRTGKIVGSDNMSETSTTASMIKAWIGSDFLRRAAEQGETPSETRLAQVSTMIRDSNNEAAQSLWQAVGGSESIQRLVSTCQLTDSKSYRNLWSNTQLSARDTARLGACIADGRAAGPEWTDWLLKEMRAVRGVGDFGVRKAFPPAERKQIAIKNGWVTRDALGEWHVNCLAIGDGWTIGVMTAYPAAKGYEYGADICQSVGEQLRSD